MTQSGEEAFKACNVFHPLTYEGAVDVDTIDDELKRAATIAQIASYGQTPTRLFKKPVRWGCSNGAAVSLGSAVRHELTLVWLAGARYRVGVSQHPQRKQPEPAWLCAWAVQPKWPLTRFYRRLLSDAVLTIDFQDSTLSPTLLGTDREAHPAAPTLFRRHPVIPF